MGSFFTPELANAFDLLDLREVVRILERDYREADEFDFAPRSYEEAMEGYRTALSMVGEIAADVIAPRSGEIDATGTTFVDGVVGYAPGTTEAYKALADAGFAGALLPRRFGGLNFPVTVYVMMIEMVSRADASLMTLFGYQDVGEAIAHFGPEEVAARLLPAYASGNRIAAMVLTEPGGGSDLAAVRTTAHQGADGRWYLNGTKQFISNGNGEVLLVLARSEPKAPGMFGLSLFASDGTGVTVSRVEEKMGLHGSPTCELVFEDAPVNLIGKRRMGMVQTMYTLNHARFSVAAQALGIAEGAYRAAASYASERHAFGKPVAEIPAVAKMLADMKLSIEACRALVYDGCARLDLRNRLEIELARDGVEGIAEKKRLFKECAAQVDFLSPAVKFYVTEAAQRVCLDAQQVFGGSGYIRETGIERLVRDVRITTIYEGTSQVQAASALGGALAGIVDTLRADEASDPIFEEAESTSRRVRSQLAAMTGADREALAGEVVSAEVGRWAGSLLAGHPAVARAQMVTVVAELAAIEARIRHGGPVEP